MGVVFKCENVYKSYGEKEVLKGLDLEIESGKIVGLLGPNGSGKTTLIKMANGLLVPSAGKITIDNKEIGVDTKKIVSYLPDITYLNGNEKVKNIIRLFEEFYEDFDSSLANELLEKLGINLNDKFKTMSKGTKEKVQLILVMSRKAKLYFLDEPISGVDPVARDYIIETIITNYNPEASIVLSTHLIVDVEKILDEVVMINEGKLVIHKSVDEIREEEGKSVDSLFRHVFKC